MTLSQTARTFLTEIDYRLQRAKYTFRGGNFSRFREQQIIWNYIELLLPKTLPRFAVDIGAGNGMRWSNTYSLFLAGWKGLGFEADARKAAQLERAYRNLPGVCGVQSEVDPDNVVEILRSFAVPKEFGVLSLDIDGNDYWVLQQILSHFRPALVVTEINEKIPPPLRFVVKFERNFYLRHHFYGFSISALEDLCADHGYGILELEYNNAFLAPKEPGSDRFVTAETAYIKGYRDRADRKQCFSTNLDLEEVLSLTPTEALAFLNEFYRQEHGRYHLAADKESFRRLMDGD